MSYESRLQDLADAARGSATPQAVIDRHADAIVAHWRQEVIGFGYDPDNLTGPQRAAFVLLKVRDWARDIQRAERQKTVVATVDPDVAAEAVQALDDWPDGIS
jgi:hypothetical protein